MEAASQQAFFVHAKLLCIAGDGETERYVERSPESNILRNYTARRGSRFPGFIHFVSLGERDTLLPHLRC